MNDSQNSAWPTEIDVTRMLSTTMARVTKHQRKTHRNRILGTTAVITVVLGSTAAAIVIPATQRSIDTSTYCYSAQSLDAASVQSIGVDGTANLDRSGGKAIEVCGMNWAIGGLAPGKVNQPATSQYAELPIPPLGVCQRPDDVLGVFPLTTDTGQVLTNEQLCQKLSLRPAG